LHQSLKVFFVMGLELVEVDILVALGRFPLLGQWLAVLAPLVDLWRLQSLAVIGAIFLASGELA
jgi:hypothetical protein